MNDDIQRVAVRAGDHPIVEWGARLGYAVNGLMHLLIAWLAVQLVLGDRGKSADQSGALQTLARTDLGRVTLFVAIAGFLLLGLWQIPEAIRLRDAGQRVKCVSKSILYLALAFSAWQFVDGAGTQSSAQTKDFTAQLMEAPFGRLLVAVVGAVIIGIGGYHVYKGWKKKFLQDLQEHPGSWAVHAGRIGYCCKGVALAAVGALFVGAALHNNPDESSGLDGALRQALQLPFGQVLALIVIAGFALFAVYSFARARYAHV